MVWTIFLFLSSPSQTTSESDWSLQFSSETENKINPPLCLSVHGWKFFHEILIFPQEPYPSFLISGQAEIKIPYPSPNFPPKILIFHNPLPPSHFRKNIDCCLSPLSSLIWSITLPDAIDSFTLIHFGTEPGYIYKKGFLVLTIFDVFF